MKNLFALSLCALLALSCGHAPSDPDVPDVPDVVVTPAPVPTPTGPDLPPAPTPDLPPAPVGKRVYSTKPIGELPEIAEKSGLCVGSDGLFYIIQDSDQSPKVSVANRSGGLVRKIEMDGVKQNDFEDVACYKDTITVGDIGDNDEERESFPLYSFTIPTGSAPKVKAQRVDVRFADGRAHNAESLFYAPNGKLYIITKNWDKTQGLYEIREAVAYLVRSLKGLEPIGGASANFAGDKFVVAIDESNEFYECSYVESPCVLVDDKKIPSGDHEAVAYTSDRCFAFISEDENEIYETCWAGEVAEVPAPTPAPVPVPEPPAPTPAPGEVSWTKPAPGDLFQIMDRDDGDYLAQLKPGVKWVEIECVPDQDEGQSAGYERLKGVISKFAAKGVNVICYHSLSWEHWRADIGRFPMAAKGAKMDGWDELWTDWRDTSPAHSFWDQRYDEFALIGAKCVEDDNMVDSEDNETGFPLTHAQSAASAKRRAEYARSKGMCHISKNNPTMSKSYAAVSDGIMIESAKQYNERAPYQDWMKALKFVGSIEYRKQDCAAWSGAMVQYHGPKKLLDKPSYFNGVNFQICK